jgi:hypothetical protein
VSVVGDTVYDARESFFVDLTAPPEVQVVRGRGTVTILEDDAVPAIVVTPYLRIDEGDSGTTSGSISVALAGEWEHAIEVRFSVFTSELPDVTVTPSGGKLMLEPQGSPQSVTFSVLGNTRPQADKSFPVYFFSGEDESVSARTVVDIIDNEPRGVYVYDVGPVREPGPGSARIVYFRVFWAGKIGQAYPVVRYATRDGTALAGSDYLSVSGDVTDWRACSSGTCEAFVPVMVQGDSLREPHESFFLDVTSDPGVAVVRGSATATVADTRGTVDFTGEGKADIVWRHTGGALFIWAMDGTSVAGASYLDPISLDWQIQGTGDFNGDGRTDSGESATPAPTSCGPWTARKSRAGQVMRTPPLAESRA